VDKKQAADWVLKNSLTTEAAWLMLITAPREGTSVTYPGKMKADVIDREIINIERRITEQGDKFDLCAGLFPDRVMAQHIIQECK